MEGFTLNRKGEFIEKIEQKSGFLALMAKNSGVEIMIQKILKGKTFYIYPNDDLEAMEFFYVLEGKMECQTDSFKSNINTYIIFIQNQ